jgi:hypothetical protein
MNQVHFRLLLKESTVFPFANCPASGIQTWQTLDPEAMHPLYKKHLATETPT